ncbi:MAG TPA: helix-turn-helix transcriptional regulator [Burkholderiaceae bacterium]|jgi:transcriptional regulator EpsA
MDVLKQAQELDINLDALMRIIVRSTEVHDSDALLALINSDVVNVLHHDAMVCGYGMVSPDGSYVHNMLHHNYPGGYFDALATPDGKADSPLIQRWRATLEPIVFQAVRDDDGYPEEWVNTFKRYGLRNTAAHGVLDVRGKSGSYFIFSNIYGEVGEKEVFLLKLLMPHLHFALMRALTTIQEYGRLAGSSQEPMNDRQKEILQWMNQGKTNWEISQILSMTENNVKYNIEQILVKLGVRNRAQAVSKAMLLGILSA